MRRSIAEIISPQAIRFLQHIPRTILTVRNWPILLSDYLGFTNKGRVYRFRNGLKIKTGDGISSGTVVITFIRKDYGPAPSAGSTVVDIGANIGDYALYAAKEQGTKVYAFEPMPANFEILQENIAMNNLQEQIFPFQYAVADKIQTIRLFLGLSPFHSVLPMAESPFHAKFEHPEAQESIEVPCTSLQAIFDEHNIKTCDILKLDCEGAEYDIIYSLPKEYFQRIKHIRMEYHNHHNNSKNTGESLMRFLKEQGFDIKKVKKGSEFQGDVWLEHS